MMELMVFLPLLGGGMLGHLLRGSIGVYKMVLEGKDVDVKRFMLTTLLGGAIGGIGSMIFARDFSTAILLGYAGVDALEGMLKQRVTTEQ